MKRRSTMALALALALLLAACGAPPAPAAETDAAPAQTAAATPEPVSDWQSEGRAYKQSPVNTGADSTFDIFGLGADYYATAMFFGTDGPSEYVLLKNGARFYAPEEAAVELACAGDGCLWLTESRRSGEARRACSCSSPRRARCSPSSTSARWGWARHIFPPWAPRPRASGWSARAKPC